MSKVGIVTDSINCLPTELIKEYDIRVVPYILVLDGKECHDQIDITPAEFWRKFSNLEKLPTTGANSPGEYANRFSELSKSTDSIVCISVSKEISAGYPSAESGIKKH
ncbi:DegV family protein [Chloroflexota bacterium]